MSAIKVIVHGALGKVGKEVVRAVSIDPATKLVGAVDIKATAKTLNIPDTSESVPFSTNLEEIIEATGPDVMVDFTLAKAAMPAIRIAAKKKIGTVTGTTGFTPEDLAEIDKLAKENGIGVIWASNFALGAIVMMHLAKIAAKYFDYAEIIELHHNQKMDAPSGTSLTTAKGMAQSRGKPFEIPPGPNRGQMIEGITLHSVRLPGMMAHQEVLFGTAGQTLSIRHDTINRECYTPGVMLAVKEVCKLKGLTQGLDKILGLQ
ncbi:MAG: 4-hydroxy-tetrahydrodipicolinate reductase [Dehalococcoidales bacterium]|nr:4-hydroxy-tetrahydrodipicolinate reductase [Dehalococcoidales bacterium]